MYKKPKDIVKDIDKDFFKDNAEARKILDEIERILSDFVERRELSETAKDVIEFLEEIWGHFSIGKYAKIFVDFAEAEKALYGLGERYRDHLIHIFNVFIMGLLTFSKMLTQDENEVFKLLKIRKESNKVPFPSIYDEQRRLYYLWCLMSTFHDIATPIEYERELLDVLKRFLGYFRIETERLAFKFPSMIQFDVSRYSGLMAKLFANGVIMTDSDELPTYELPEEHTASSLYFRSALTDAMDKRNHGVFGAYFLYRSIEEMFLSGPKYDLAKEMFLSNLKYDLDLSAVIHDDEIITLPENKLHWNDILKELILSEEELNKLPRIYDFSRGETKLYNDYVIEQDVTRAALAIALHNLDPSNQPKIFPIRFSKLPLCYLLILFDELQEFYRPEGIVLTEVVKFHEFPLIDVSSKLSDQGEKRIQITVSFDLKKLQRKKEKLIIDRYNKLARSQEKPVVENFEELVRATWNFIFDTLQRKLSFRNEEPVEIYVRVSVEGKDPNGKALEFRSPNWRASHEGHSKTPYYVYF